MSPRPRFQPNPDFVEEVVGRFMQEFPAAVLVGGWATSLRTGSNKSHDIDVIVDLPTLGLLTTRYQLTASSHVGGRKFQMVMDGVEVDVYPVFQSRLGAELHVPVEILAEHLEMVRGLRTLSREGLFVAKMAALLDRPDSLPGEKDRREIWQLLNVNDQPMDYRVITAILAGAGWDSSQQAALLSRTFLYLEETDTIQGRDRARLRRLREEAVAFFAQVIDASAIDNLNAKPRPGPE